METNIPIVTQDEELTMIDLTIDDDLNENSAMTNMTELTNRTTSTSNTSNSNGTDIDGGMTDTTSTNATNYVMKYIQLNLFQQPTTKTPKKKVNVRDYKKSSGTKVKNHTRVIDLFKKRKYSNKK